jgi:hypothetical protein
MSIGIRNKCALRHLRMIPCGISDRCCTAPVAEDWIHDTDLPCEPVGSGQIAMGSVKQVSSFLHDLHEELVGFGMDRKGV